MEWKDLTPGTAWKNPSTSLSLRSGWQKLIVVKRFLIAIKQPMDLRSIVVELQELSEIKECVDVNLCL